MVASSASSGWVERLRAPWPRSAAASWPTGSAGSRPWPLAGIVGVVCAVGYVGLKAAAAEQPRRFSARESVGALRERPLLSRIALAQGFYGGGLIAAAPLFALVHVDRLNLSLSDVGVIGILAAVATTVAFPLWGLVADRYGALASLRLGSAIGLLALVAYAFAPSVVVLWFAAVAAGIGSASIDVGIAAAVSDQTPLASRAAAMAGWNALTGARGIVAAFLMSAAAPDRPDRRHRRPARLRRDLGDRRRVVRPGRTATGSGRCRRDLAREPGRSDRRSRRALIRRSSPIRRPDARPVDAGRAAEAYDPGMRLTAWEEERLLLFSAAELARQRRARGVRLSAPDAIAIICDALLEAARDGADLDAVEAAGREAVGPDDVLDGVRELVDEVRLEVAGRGRDTTRGPRRPAGPRPAHGARRAGRGRRRSGCIVNCR